MISISRNKIHVGDPQNQDMSHPKPHLVMKDDPRPKCALVIGDGFTQGYLRHYNLHKQIPCTINDLVPSSDILRYIPTQGDIFGGADSKFFTKEKWPKMFHAISEGLTGSTFFEKISKQKINPQYENGLWSLNNNTIDYEIRCYLWHYFRSAHQKLLELRSPRSFSSGYGWYVIFKTILERYFLQIISFNYDCVAQVAISETQLLYAPGQINKRIFGIFKFPVEMAYDYYMNFYGTNEIPVVYIHGSWISQILFPFPKFFAPAYSSNYEGEITITDNVFFGDENMAPPTIGFVANPWLANKIQFVDNYFSTVTSRVNPMPKEFPMFPDIVPPGFQGHDKYNPYSKATDTSRKILNEADLVIICGLSGNEPDTEEVTDLLSNINKATDVVHVGLAHDKNNPVAMALKKMPHIKWQFFEATNELARVDEYLKDKRL